MRPSSPSLVLVGGGLALAAVFAGAASGRLGPLQACGADGANVCIAWPGIASAVMWLSFVVIIAALAVWQARDWRHTSVARREVVALLVLLALALIERAVRPDLADVGYDEASAASLVAAWRLDGLFPLTGIISSVSIPNPPGWPYLLALVLLWFDSPYGVVALGIAAGMLTIVLTWWVARRWIGAAGALGAAVFYAGAFWPSFLGRGGWQPIFLQLPVILCLDALLILAVRRWPWALAIACGWLALMVQLHYIALAFAPMLLIAAWPARRVLRPIHVVAGGLIGLALLAPFVVYELSPQIALRDVTELSTGAGGEGSHWDLEAWNLLWTLAANGGVAGLAGTHAEELRQALGRWSSIGLIGLPLVALGLVAALAGWPRGWRGGIIAAWTLALPITLAHHTLGLLPHYLFLSFPGMALAVGALTEWTSFRGRRIAQAGVGVALALYVRVSAATLWTVLAQAQQNGGYADSARPLGLNMAAAESTRAVMTPGDHVLIGGHTWEVEILRFSLGHNFRPRIFDDCTELPMDSPALYLLSNERSPAARQLAASGAPLLARVPRPDGDFVVYGDPTGPIPNNMDTSGCGA